MLTASLSVILLTSDKQFKLHCVKFVGCVNAVHFLEDFDTIICCVQIYFNDAAIPYKHECSCAAGQAPCHHAVALVYQIQHYQKLGMTVVPSIVSKTFLPQVCNNYC
jgi:hypothetical protein